MNKMFPEVSHERRNFIAAGTDLLLAATTLGKSGAALAQPAGNGTDSGPSDAVPTRKQSMDMRKLGSLEVSSMGLGCLPMVG